MNSKGKSSLNVILGVISLMLVSRGLGLLRDTLIGYRFGSSLETDAYFGSILITTSLFLSFGSALATNTVPYIVRARRQEATGLNRIIVAVLGMASALTVAYWFLLPLVMKYYVKSASAAEAAQTYSLSRILIPAVWFVIMTYFFVGVLQGSEHFTLPAMVSLPFNLLFFAYLILWSDQYGVVGLAWVTSIGWGLQCVFVGIPVLYKKILHVPAQLRLPKSEPVLKTYFMSLVPIIIVTMTHQLNLMVDNWQAYPFVDGSNSAIYYGNVLFKAIVTTTVYGITAVMFPKFNSRYIDADRVGLYQSVINVLRSISLLLIPMSVGLIFFGSQVISLIFYRGQFTAEDVSMTMVAFSGYTSFMIAFGIIEVVNKAFYTVNNRRIPLLITVAITVGNFALSMVLTQRIGFGGIAVGTSLAYYLGAILALGLFLKEEDGGGKRRLFVTCSKAVVAALAMGICLYLYKGAADFYRIEGAKDIGLLIVGIGLGIIVYGVMLLAVKEELITYNVKKLLRKI